MIRLFPPLRKSWARVGQQAQVLLSGQNARRVIFGALDLQRGKRVLLIRPRQQQRDFAMFLRLLRRRQPNGSLALLLDENRIHTLPQTLKLAAALHIVLIFLPKRSPHLNPADHLWRFGKQTFCANRQDLEIDALAAAFVDGLRHLSPHEALRKAGVFSKRFWLRRVLSILFRKDT